MSQIEQTFTKYQRASTDERARRCVSHGSCSDRPGSAQSPKRSRARLWEPSLDEEIGHTQRAKVDRPLRIAHQEPLMREPETRPISQEQIVAEVKSIYSGLVMVENKCIEVNQLQTENTGEKSDLTHQQWQALITLHRTLLHEHHDFFLASQHPSANAALKRLAAKYAMPARMWRHGIHSFLELLRHNLPQSRDYMLSFIYLAYSMMALLYETVPAFEETWIECLGDLSRYRMAIEEDDIRDREIWTGVSRNWYSKASEKSPTTGRLYHHLAILARPNALQQLFCYSKSLCVVVPFPSARESIITLFDPLLDPENSVNISVDAAFVRVQGILFTGKAHKDELSAWRSDFLGRFDGHIGRTGRRWLESGYFTGISLACSLLGFGEENNVLMRAISQSPKDGDGDLAEGLPETLPNESFKAALSFAVETWSIVFQRWGDINTLTCHHTMLVFLLHMLRFPAAMVHMEKKLPWKLITIMLNRLLDTTKYRPELEDPDSEDSFPGPENDSYRPLPEEYTLRGVVHAEAYLPKSMFPKEFDEDEKYIETSSMAADRVNRILWMGCKIARSKNWLIWDAGNNEFGTAMEYDVVVENIFPKDYDSDSEDAFAALSRPLWRVVDWAWNTKHSEHCPAGRLTNSDTESEVCLARRPGPPPTGKSIIEELNTYCEGPDSVCGRDSTGADFGRESFLGCLLKRAKSLLSATWNSSISSALFSTRSLEKAWCEDLVRITCSPTTTPFMCRF